MARYGELGQVNRSGSQEYISKAQVSERCDRHECSAPKMGMRNVCVFSPAKTRGVFLAVVTPHCLEGVSRTFKNRWACWVAERLEPAFFGDMCAIGSWPSNAIITFTYWWLLMYVDIYTHTYSSYMSIIASVGRTDGTWLPAPFRPALLAAFVYKLGPTEFTIICIPRAWWETPNPTGRWWLCNAPQS